MATNFEDLLKINAPTGKFENIDRGDAGYLEQEIRIRQDLLNRLDQGDPTAYTEADQRFGITPQRPYAGPAQTERDKQLEAAGYKKTGGTIGRLTNEVLSQLPAVNSADNIRQGIMGQISGLQGRLGVAYEKLFGQYSEAAKKREAALGEALTKTQEGLQSYIDQYLQSQLADIGIAGGEARQNVGASLASRGLDQSTIAGKRIGDVTLREQESAGSARENARSAQAGISQDVKQAKEAVAKERQKAEISRDITSLRTINELGFSYDTNQLENQFKQELSQMKMDANDQNLLYGLFGDILGAAAGIAIGAA